MNTTKFIPLTMKKLNNWVYWKKLERDGKTTKIPVNVLTGNNAMSNNPKTWVSYDTATSMKNDYVNGLGFMLPLDESITMIDLDHCIDGDRISDFAQNVLSRFKDTFVEVSQSGSGLHIYVKGKIKRSIKNKQIEIYSKTRFCATTGNALQCFDLAEHQAELDLLYQKYGKEEPKHEVITSVSEMTIQDIMQVIRSSKNADKFNYYFNNGEANSENTLGLCSILAFYCGNDKRKIKDIFRMSNLMRDKCDSRRGNQTWLDYVIDEAVKSNTQIYEPKKEYIEPPIKERAEKIEEDELRNRFTTISEIEDVDEDKIKYIHSGFSSLDKQIIGFAEDEVSVWSGLNGSGKSNFLLQQILEYAVQNQKTMLFSGEMQDYVLRNILIRMVAGKSLLRQSKKGIYYLPDGAKKKTILNWLNNYVWIYKNSCSMEVREVLDAIKYVVKKQNVKMVILDNLMTLNLRSLSSDKYEAQSIFAKELARIAKELHIHIHVVMHPRKASGFLRKDDISGSADLSNAVDNVFIIHRVNNDFKSRVVDTYGKKEVTPLFSFNNVIEVCKNRRNGVQDSLIPFYFEPESKRFVSAAKESRVYIYGIGG